MPDPKLLQRITSDPDIFGGKPIVRGHRIAVELVLALLAQGRDADSIIAEYPDLEVADVRACIAYAHAVIASETMEN